MLIAHLSDLHLRSAGDVVWLERQLDRIVARRVDHLAITGDLLDRWIPPLLDRVLDALDARGLLQPDRLTILHGNHDLASSGGHPRQLSDLWRLGLRFWDPPPLLRWRRRRFAAAIARRCIASVHSPGLVADPAPFVKTVAGSARVAVLDTILFPWRPFRVRRGAVSVCHGVGTIPARQIRWLEQQPEAPGPLIVLMHHFPLETPGFRWKPQPGWMSRLPTVHVPMAVPEEQRRRFWAAARTAAVRLVLCGHVHRARLDWHGGIAVGLNGQSGAAWAGRPIAFYDVTHDSVVMSLEVAAGWNAG